MTLSWKARRKGNTYCSPACGRGCSITEYREAQTAALKLAVRLSSVSTDTKIGKWKIRIWENLGWHWSVGKGSVTVAGSSRSWSAYLNVSGPWGGNMVTNDKTPERAIHRLLVSAKRQLLAMTKLAQKLEMVRP